MEFLTSILSSDLLLIVGIILVAFLVIKFIKKLVQKIITIILSVLFFIFVKLHIIPFKIYVF